MNRPIERAPSPALQPSYTMNTDTLHQAPSQAELEGVLASIRIPACPAIVSEVMFEAQREEPSLKVLTRILSSDVGLSAMAVKLANSPIFGSTAPVRSVQQAVSRLGIGNILNVVIAAALRNASEHPPTPLMERFWSRASTLALAAGVLARRHVGIPPESAYTYALFHDAAIPVMLSNFPEYADVYAASQDRGATLLAQEQQRFRCDHAVVGWLLARNWGLPAKIAAAIRYHHDPEVYILPEKELPAGALALIAVTLISEHVLSEFVEDADIVNERALEDARIFLGTSDADIDDFRETIITAIA